MRVRRRVLAAGHSLIEVLIAVFVVAGCAMMFSALIPPSVKTGRMVGNYQQAASLVQHKVDQLRAVGYGRLNYTELSDAGIIDPDVTTLPFHFDQVDDLNSLYPGPSATVNVEDFSANVRRVTVTLTWTGSAYKQGNGSLTAVALIARG
jgi:type II secretory pathway pseudopilin PulG